MAEWQTNVPVPQDGDGVVAESVARPVRALAERDKYLKGLIDGAALGEALVAYAAPVETAAVVGMAVAWNPATSRYERALAAATVDPATGALTLASSAYARAVVVAKLTAASADLLIGGRMPVDLTASAGADPAPGFYYLSATVPGGLRPLRPGVGIQVGFWDGTYFYLEPRVGELLDAHRHFSVKLACKPAGGNLNSGGVHTVTSPDATQLGWLPAGHASFGGKAPTRAAVGYNIAADATVKALWPPTPIDSVQFWFDRGGDGTGAKLLPKGLNGLMYADRWGIWWMSNCSGDVPWPTAYDAMSPPTPAPPNSSSPECPRLVDMQLTMSFTHMLSATDRTVVTSLKAATGSPVVITSCLGGPASAGDLVIDLPSSLIVDPVPDEAGAIAFKRISGNVLHGGPIVEALVAGSNVTLTPTIGDGANAQGTVTIDVDVDPIGRELMPRIMYLAEAVQRDASGVPYVSLPSDRTSSVRLLFDLPYAGLPASPTLKLSLWLLGTATGTLPTMAVSYRRMARPTSGGVALASSDTPATIMTGVAVTANNYVRVESTAFAVAAGDLVLATITRTGSGGYSGEAGLLHVAAVIGAAP